MDSKKMAEESKSPDRKPKIDFNIGGTEEDEEQKKNIFQIGDEDEKDEGLDALEKAKQEFGYEEYNDSEGEQKVT